VAFATVASRTTAWVPAVQRKTDGARPEAAAGKSGGQERKRAKQQVGQRAGEEGGKGAEKAGVVEPTSVGAPAAAAKRPKRERGGVSRTTVAQRTPEAAAKEKGAGGRKAVGRGARKN